MSTTSQLPVANLPNIESELVEIFTGQDLLELSGDVCKMKATVKTRLTEKFGSSEMEGVWPSIAPSIETLVGRYAEQIKYCTQLAKAREEHVPCPQKILQEHLDGWNRQPQSICDAVKVAMGWSESNKLSLLALRRGGAVAKCRDDNETRVLLLAEESVGWRLATDDEEKQLDECIKAIDELIQFAQSLGAGTYSDFTNAASRLYELYEAVLAFDVYNLEYFREFYRKMTY